MLFMHTRDIHFYRLHMLSLRIRASTSIDESPLTESGIENALKLLE